MLHRIATRAIDALVVVSLLVPALPASAAPPAGEATATAAPSSVQAAALESPGYQPPTFAHPSPRFGRRSTPPLNLSPQGAAQGVLQTELLFSLSSGASGDSFGASVAGVGDTNHDGHSELLVGAPGADPASGADAGSGFLFSGLDGGVLHRLDGEAPGDSLGSSVLGAGDVDGDSVPDMLIGAPSADPGGVERAGSAYVFSGADQSELWRFDGPQPYDEFGRHVAGEGDVVRDAHADLAIELRNTTRVYSGADGTQIYEFPHLDSNFHTGINFVDDVNADGIQDVASTYLHGSFDNGYSTAYLRVHSGADGSLLIQRAWYLTVQVNFPVISAGDLTGDDRGDLWLATPQQSCGSLGYPGAVHLISGADQWGSTVRSLCGESNGDRFGTSLARLGDLDGDGFSEIAVGAPYADPGGLTSAGSAYVFSGASGTLLSRLDGSVANQGFGWDVANARDVDGDGTEDLIVGSYNSSTGLGSASVYRLLQLGTVPDAAVACSGNIKYGGPGATGECEASTYGATQGTVADPINTRTGSFDFGVVDLSISTSSGPLVFQINYSSQAAADDASALGYGWTHNLDSRLILPGQPGAVADSILFKAHTSNLYTFDDNGDGTYSPAPGVLASLTLDPGPPVSYTVTNPSQDVYLFDEVGQLLEWSDAQGHTIAYTHDASGRLTQISADSGARSLTLAYDDQDRITSVTDHSGRVVQYAYDIDGNLSIVHNVVGNDTIYYYELDHRLTEVIRGHTELRTEYDAEGRAVRQFDGEGNKIAEITYNADGTTTIVDALGNTETHTYDYRNTLTDEEDPLGATSSKAYDASFRPTTLTDAAGDTTSLAWSPGGANLLQVTDAEGGVTDLEYDTLNNLTSVTDPLGYLTTYEYSGTLLTSSTDTLDGTTTYTYTPEGYLESVTDARGWTTSYTYDSYGQRTSMADALGHTTTYAYDDLGRLIETTDPLGHVTRSEYDDAGRLIRSIRSYDPGRPQNDENQYNIVTEYWYDQRGNQLWVMDTYGRRTYSEYDANDRLTRTIDAQGHETTNAYDDAGRLISTRDALNRTTTYEYDDAGRLTATTDALGGVTHSTYNPDGTLASTADALGHTTIYAYDSLKRVTAVTDALGGVTQTTYDAAGNVASTTDTRGETTTFEYDALGRLIRQTDAEGGATEHFYDAAGNRIQTIDPLGHRTTYVYNALNQLTAVADHLGHTTEYAYDAVGNLTSTTDGNGNSTTYTYDALGRVVTTTDALGSASHSEYDALSNILVRTDANGHTTTLEYDSLGRLIRQTDAEGGLTSLSYDAVGNQLTVTDPNDHTTTTVYDALNRPVSVTDANGIETTRSYDAGGNLVASTDGLGSETTFSHDALNRQVSVTDPLGNTTSFGYDAGGNRTSMMDAEGVVTRYEYDGLGRLTAVVENYVDGAGSDAEANVRTEYGYDDAGNRLSIRDGNGHVTAFAYNAVNRLVRETDAMGHETSYVYDAAGNRTGLIDANSVTTTYLYDEANRLTDILYPPPEPPVTFTYDDAGNRISMTDNSGQTTWEYDGLNRPTVITSEETGRVGYGYDAAGNRTSLTYPDGKFVSYAYDPGSRMTGVTAWDSTTTTYTYDAANRVATTSLPNGVVSSYAYDPAGRLLELAHAKGMQVLSSFGYAYDAVGNRVQAVEHLAMPGGGPTILVTVADTSGSPLPGLTVYAFNGDTYSGYSRVTDEAGVATITLPAGDYRFRVDVDGTQFWSGPANHCPIPGCFGAVITVPPPVLVSVTDTQSAPMQGLPVFAFSGGAHSGFSGTTDENGQVSLRLPAGAYRFRADSNGTQFWSSTEEDCNVPGCTLATITITLPVEVTVEDSFGTPQPGLPVYAFSGGVSTGYSGTTDESGTVSMTLPEGAYRFRSDLNGTQFWSGTDDHCVIPGCEASVVTVTVPVSVQVWQWDTGPLSGIPVYAFQGSTYTGYHATTDDDGFAMLTLPEGSYHFRADVSGTQYWDSTEDSCTVPGCEETWIDVPRPVIVTVLDTDGFPAAGLPVYAFDGDTFTGYDATTNAEGQASLMLPFGSYRFRADRNGTQFWSGEVNHCDVPPCDAATVTVTTSSPTPTSEPTSTSTPEPTFTPTLEPTPTDTPEPTATDTPEPTATQVGYLGRGNALAMPIALLSRWLVPAAVERPAPAAGKLLDLSPVAVTVQDTDGAPQAGLPVYAFNNTTYAGYSATTNASGIATLTLPDGNYRFRSDLNGTQFWSGAENHCTVPGCEVATVVVTIPVTVTVLDTDSQPVQGLSVYAFNGTAYTGFSRTTSATGEAVFTLPQGSYRFRADRIGTQFWSGTANHCDIPGCTSAGVAVTIPLVVTVRSTGGTPQAGLPVYAFNGATYTGYSRTTDASGEAVFTLPQGSYRFRSDRDGTQFWSGEANHCDVPGCLATEVVVTLPVTVTVLDTDGDPQAGLPVYAFDGDTYTGFSGTTDDLGDVPFTLPEGSYRFRADLLGTQFWSSDVNHCDVPGCEDALIEITSPLVVTVLDTDGTPKVGLPVYAFDGETYTGFNGVTNASGEATFVLPAGSYRFRTDLNGTQFWSGEANHCGVPGCVAASVTVTIPLTVSVENHAGTAYPDLPVYAFVGDTYTGFNRTSDAEGNVIFTLPIGDYRFRADLDGVQFWSGEATTCTIPGCIKDLVPIPGGTIETDVTIDYTYDPLYRLTAADYSTGEFFHYTYDAVGNRLTQETEAGTSAYTYDIANRLTSVDGVTYTWDDNGSLLSDGASTYTYDHANRLREVQQGDANYTFFYDGLGNRVQQIAPDGTPYDYTLDLAAGLTQVLDDTVSTYLYGRARIGEEQPDGWQYHLGDALGSVRELAASTGTVGLAQSFEPFGRVMAQFGSASTGFGFTGEQLDGTGLVYLRARYYASYLNQWIQPDQIVPDPYIPGDWNRYAYVRNNPVTWTDPSGLFVCTPMPHCQDWVINALAQMDVSGGMFARLVVGSFWSLDEQSGGDRLRVNFTGSGDWGTSAVDYFIQLPRNYIGRGLPLRSYDVSLFAHEVVHQTQSWQERLSIWGEAQGYIFQAKVMEEMQVALSPFFVRVLDTAFDLASPGFTTWDPADLAEVRSLLLTHFKFNPWYLYEPLLPSDWANRYTVMCSLLGE
jgi:RHS repeat-associated protein